MLNLCGDTEIVIGTNSCLIQGEIISIILHDFGILWESKTGNTTGCSQGPLKTYI